MCLSPHEMTDERIAQHIDYWRHLALLRPADAALFNRKADNFQAVLDERRNGDLNAQE